MIITDERFPGPGVVTCGVCRTQMPVGTPYCLDPEGMNGDLPVEVVICTGCSV